MVARIEKTNDGYMVPLTAEMVDALNLSEGAEVKIVPIADFAEEPRPQIRYATVEEVMEAHRKMEPFHAEAYRELAK